VTGAREQAGSRTGLTTLKGEKGQRIPAEYVRICSSKDPEIAAKKPLHQADPKMEKELEADLL
jgi:hypothetical protein